MSGNQNRISFIESAEKRSNYIQCLIDVQDYLNKHCIAIKYLKMNNIKGINRILTEMINNVDRFIEEGEDIELVIK